MRTSPITRFPLLQTVLPTHEEAMILCAEVRAGNVGYAVSIADAPLITDIITRTVHLGAAPLNSCRVGNT